MRKDNMIYEIIDNEIKKETFPGIVILVRKKGNIVFQTAAGKRQIYPAPENITPNSVFDLASLTKPLATTITALSVLEKEHISPLLTIGKFIPDLSKETSDVTLHQLFTHTSGLAPGPEIFRLFQEEDDIDQEKALNHLFSLTPTIKPGTQVVYSCTGYMLLTQILERITGGKLPNLFTDLVISPGSISGLTFKPRMESDNIVATEYCPWRKRWIKGEVHDENAFCFNGVGGNAGLFGHASSVLELLSLFRDGGVLNGIQILSEESVRLMTSNQTPGFSPKRAYGFLMQDKGSMAGPDFSPNAFGHTGFTGTSVWIDPDRELEFVILTNRVHFGRNTNSDKIKSFRKRIHSALVREFSSTRY
ncbi:MAG: serine hydrolase [Spirochaetes bacterium]|nr:MAG: serine hydrolase [Spirochaetota bacterium]